MSSIPPQTSQPPAMSVTEAEARAFRKHVFSLLSSTARGEWLDQWRQLRTACETLYSKLREQDDWLLILDAQNPRWSESDRAQRQKDITTVKNILRDVRGEMGCMRTRFEQQKKEHEYQQRRLTILKAQRTDPNFKDHYESDCKAPRKTLFDKKTYNASDSE
jgi:hypothetical protein